VQGSSISSKHIEQSDAISSRAALSLVYGEDVEVDAAEAAAAAAPLLSSGRLLLSNCLISPFFSSSPV